MMKLTFPRLVVALTFLAILALAARVSVDSDTWWHLRTGQWILEHRVVPQTDPFSSTFLGQPWLYPSAGWLSEVALFTLFVQWGYAGLNLFTAGCVVFAFVFVHKACQGPALVRAFVLILAATVSSIFWSARPQIISFLFSSVFAYLLHQFRWNNRNHLWVMVPLMAVWANLHGGFAIGFILIALTLAGQVVTLAWRWLEERLWAGGDTVGSSGGDVGWRGVVWLVGIGLACAGAVMVNPAGPAMLLYPFQTVAIGVLRDFIQEWQSPNFHELRSQTFLWLLLGTLAIIPLSPRRVNFTDLVMVCGLGYLGFLAGRNVPLLALVAPPVLTRHLAAIIEGWQSWALAYAPAQPKAPPAHVPHATSARALLINWALLVLLTLAVGVRVALALPPALNEKELRATLPFGAAEYLLRQRPPGPLFNAYNFGGYLSWALYPHYPIFIDGRTDLYSEDFLRQYLAVSLARPGYQDTFDKYGINVVVVEQNSFLAFRLSEAAGWRETYRDAVAVVYERQRP